MSEAAKRFHKNEAAKILVDLRKNTEGERLMNYRRHLLNRNANDMDENDFPREFRDRLEQACWPWSYPNYAVPPTYNTMPLGYPNWPPHPLYRFPNAPPPFMSEAAATNPYLQSYAMPGMESHPTYPWNVLPHQQASVDPVHNNRRRRTRFSEKQLEVLEKTFLGGSKFPSPGERMLLEAKTGLAKEKISVWFQNRRAKEKKQGSRSMELTPESEMETEGDVHPSSDEETTVKGDNCHKKMVETDPMETELNTKFSIGNQTNTCADLSKAPTEAFISVTDFSDEHDYMNPGASRESAVKSPVTATPNSENKPGNSNNVSAANVETSGRMSDRTNRVNSENPSDHERATFYPRGHVSCERESGNSAFHMSPSTFTSASKMKTSFTQSEKAVSSRSVEERGIQPRSLDYGENESRRCTKMMYPFANVHKVVQTDFQPRHAVKKLSINNEVSHKHTGMKRRVVETNRFDIDDELRHKRVLPHNTGCSMFEGGNNALEMPDNSPLADENRDHSNAAATTFRIGRTNNFENCQISDDAHDEKEQPTVVPEKTNFMVLSHHGGTISVESTDGNSENCTDVENSQTIPNPYKLPAIASFFNASKSSLISKVSDDIGERSDSSNKNSELKEQLDDAGNQNIEIERDVVHSTCQIQRNAVVDLNTPSQSSHSEKVSEFEVKKSEESVSTGSSGRFSCEYPLPSDDDLPSICPGSAEMFPVEMMEGYNVGAPSVVKTKHIDNSDTLEIKNEDTNIEDSQNLPSNTDDFVPPNKKPKVEDKAFTNSYTIQGNPIADKRFHDEC